MTIHRSVQILFVLLLSLLAVRVEASQHKKNSIHAVKINKELKITGRLSDPLWSKAEKVPLNYEAEPNDNKKALQKTYAMVLYNKSTLYVGFICKDTHPGQIRAHVTERDKISGDDYVGIMIDPYNNNQTSYDFFVNPDDIQMDMRSNGIGPGYHQQKSYNALWYSETAVNDTGYTAVIALPFNSLNFPNKKVQSWSIQFVRNYPRSNDYKFTWTYINLNESCQLCQDGKLDDLQGVSSHNTVDFLPYVIGTQNSTLHNSDNPASGLKNNPVNIRAGGSISYSPTSSLSLNAVFNPDFSQVATDATRISVNNTFAVSYPEKRPFFMKGSNLFHTPMHLFHSRTINDPLMAGKAIEKSGNFSLAYLTAFNRNSGFIIPGLQGSDLVNSNLESYSNILRPRYNFGSNSYIGGIFSTRNIKNSHNYVSSIDWDIRLIHHYYFNGQFAYSNTKQLNDTSITSGIDNRYFGQSQFSNSFNGQQFNGNALRLVFQRRAKYYSFRLRYKGYSPTFQAQNGFITHTNYREYRVDQQISYYPSNTILDHGNAHMEGRLRYDFNGRLMNRHFSVDVFNQFTHQTGLFMSYDIINDQRYDDIMFKNLHRFHIGMHSNPTNFLSFGGHINLGKYIYHTDATLGKGYNFSGGIRVKPTPRLNIHFSFSYSKLSSAATGQEYYSGDITRLVGMYNFTKRLFIRMIGQYDSFNHQVQIYPLIDYKVNPFTIFYAGMTDYADRVGNPNRILQTNREFFVKFQYLIRR